MLKFARREIAIGVTYFDAMRAQHRDIEVRAKKRFDRFFMDRILPGKQQADDDRSRRLGKCFDGAQQISGVKFFDFETVRIDPSCDFQPVCLGHQLQPG